MAQKSVKKIVTTRIKGNTVSASHTGNAGKIISQTSKVKALTFSKKQEQKLFKILAS